jgi:hypothetical protein
MDVLYVEIGSNFPLFGMQLRTLFHGGKEKFTLAMARQISSFSELPSFDPKRDGDDRRFHMRKAYSAARNQNPS